MNVLRYTVRIQLETIMPLFLRDMIYKYHYDWMVYFPTLLQGNLASNQLWMRMSHQFVQQRFIHLHHRNGTLTWMPAP